MTDLIPHLKELNEGTNGFGVPHDFVGHFVQAHGDDWRLAQSHWELVVELVLDTDAVDPKANGLTAMRQAVRASHTLLRPIVAKSRCPICYGRKESR